MFDNYQTGSLPDPSGQAKAPVTPNNTVPQRTVADDMFAGVGVNATPQGLPPAIYGPAQFGNMPPQMNQPTPPPSGSFKFLVTGLITLLLVLAGGVVAYQMVLKPKFQSPVVTNDTNENNEDPEQAPDDSGSENYDSQLNNQAEATQPIEVATSSEQLIEENQENTETLPSNEVGTGEVENQPEVNEVNADADSDGLLDDAELLSGTNPAMADTDSDDLSDGSEINNHKTNPLKKDTDSDGLSDGEEINIYQTSPLIADTDADGYNDGQEVKNGYNPKGSGRLMINN